MVEEVRLCTHCGNKEEFYTNEDTKCKSCRRDYAIWYSRTKEGLITKIYAHQKQSSKNRKHENPTYSKSELYAWLMSKEEFHVMYNNWKRLDYQKGYTPSIDRLDNSFGYTMANIQLVTWEVNQILARVNSKNVLSKPVVRLSKNGEILEHYESGKVAARIHNISAGHISKVCKGKRKSAGGFMWKFQKDINTK